MEYGQVRITSRRPMWHTSTCLTSGRRQTSKTAQTELQKIHTKNKTYFW